MWIWHEEVFFKMSIFLHKPYLVKWSTKGERGKKCPKKCPHGLWMTPKVKLKLPVGFYYYFIFQAVQCVVKFMRGPTYISSEIVDQKDAAFPAMTVCPVSNGYKEEVLEDNGIESIKRYNYKTDLNWSSNDTSITESELFEKATYNLNELVKRVYVRFFKANPVRHFPIKNPYF